AVRARCRKHEPVRALAACDVRTVPTGDRGMWLELGQLSDRPAADRVLDAGARGRGAAWHSYVAPDSDRCVGYERGIGDLVARCIAEATDRLRRRRGHARAARCIRAKTVRESREGLWDDR